MYDDVSDNLQFLKR